MCITQLRSTGRALSSTSRDVKYSVGSSEYFTCSAGAVSRLADARGCVSLVACDDGIVAVLDHQRAYRPYVLVEGLLDPILGAGFVAGSRTVSGDLMVAPLQGTARGSLGSGSAVDLDDSGTSAAFIDDSGVVRMADLSAWSRKLESSNPENAAPTVNARLKWFVDGTYAVTFRATDPTGESDYYPSDVNSRDREGFTGLRRHHLLGTRPHGSAGTIQH